VATGGDGQASIASPTTTAGGTPTSWVISAYSVDDTYLIPLDDTCAINAASGSCTIGGLVNGQPYKFKALPSNSQGVGRVSPVSNQVIPAVNPNPPGPTPAFPPSPPRDVTGAPGDGSATVSWRAPADTGSFPVSNYKVTAMPGGRGCLTTTLTCTVTGLTNGTGYTFTVQALNGAGWGAASEPSAVVTPGTDPSPAITLSKQPRESHGRRDRLSATGSVTAIEPGTVLTPFIKSEGQSSFRQGGASVTVRSDGTFRWSRHVARGRGLTAYMAWQDVESNRIHWAKVG
jgi:hypothetical protein